MAIEITMTIGIDQVEMLRVDNDWRVFVSVVGHRREGMPDGPIVDLSQRLRERILSVGRRHQVNL